MIQKDQKYVGFLFSPDMVAALENGTKTQTRRLCKPQPPLYSGSTHIVEIAKQEFINRYGAGSVGDIMYAKEKHYQYGHWGLVEGKRTKQGKMKWEFIHHAGTPTYYHAKDLPYGHKKSMNKANPQTPAWYSRNSLFMRRRDARFFYKITAVRVERAQDISEADAVAEGIAREWDGTHHWYQDYNRPDVLIQSPKNSFFSLWQVINGDSLAANPWVFVYQFEILEQY